MLEPTATLLAVSHDNGYWLLNLATGEGQSSSNMVHLGGIQWLAWHPEGRILAVAGKTKTGPPAITLYDVATGQQALAPLEGHKTSGVVMSFSHAGDRLLSTDWNGLWRLWDTGTGQLLLTIPGGGPFPCFSPDDDLAGTGSRRTRCSYPASSPAGNCAPSCNRARPVRVVT